jgi:ParB family transcriptional regulator, chromosome partitioning protein
MTEAMRPRGLGRGLASLLGEALMPEQPAPAPANSAAQPVAFTPVTVAPQPAFTPVPTPSAMPPALPIEPEPAPPPSASITPFPAPVSAPAQVAPIEPAAPARTGARFIPLALIHRNPHQPRKHFDETELAELADSVRARGVLQPILVRPVSGAAEERYEIVAGERRWRAAQRAGLHEIPAVIRELDDVEILEIGIIENVQRADLNPIEEAMGYQALVDRFGRTQQELAEVVGKSRPHIANTLRLLGLPVDVQEMVRDGRLTAGHARAILTAPNMMELAHLAISQGLNVREIERLAQQAKEARDGARVRPGSALVAEKDADTRALELRLSDALGLPVTISHKGEQGGAISVSYRTLEQLDEVVRRLGG